MTPIDLTFIVLTAIVLAYLFIWIISHRRLPLVVESVFLLMYVISTLFFFWPSTWDWLNESFGVQLLLDLVLVVAIFLLFGACVTLYRKLERSRQDITNLAREVALHFAKKK